MFRCTLPEGVEIKLSCELITPLSINKIIKAAYSTPNSRYKNTLLASFLEGAQVTSIKTRGKFMYWQFDNNYIMYNTFGMSGQWSPEPGKHPCFIIEFEDNSKICFNDPRHFGTVSFTNNPQDLTEKLDTFGWDPLKFGMDESWINWVISKLQAIKKPIGEVMMDQSIYNGCGNYLRSEAMYRVEMSPWRQCYLLTNQEIKNLCQALYDVMQDSYNHQGATILTYKDAYGAEGKYSSCFKVYGKKQDSFGNKIIKEEMPKGRSIHWSPAIQK